MDQVLLSVLLTPIGDPLEDETSTSTSTSTSVDDYKSTLVNISDLVIAFAFAPPAAGAVAASSRAALQALRPVSQNWQTMVLSSPTGGWGMCVARAGVPPAHYGGGASTRETGITFDADGNLYMPDKQRPEEWDEPRAETMEYCRMPRRAGRCAWGRSWMRLLCELHRGRRRRSILHCGNVSAIPTNNGGCAAAAATPGRCALQALVRILPLAATGAKGGRGKRPVVLLFQLSPAAGAFRLWLLTKTIAEKAWCLGTCKNTDDTGEDGESPPPRLSSTLLVHAQHPLMDKVSTKTLSAAQCRKIFGSDGGGGNVGGRRRSRSFTAAHSAALTEAKHNAAGVASSSSGGGDFAGAVVVLTGGSDGTVKLWGTACVEGVGTGEAVQLPWFEAALPCSSRVTALHVAGVGESTAASKRPRSCAGTRQRSTPNKSTGSPKFVLKAVVSGSSGHVYLWEFDLAAETADITTTLYSSNIYGTSLGSHQQLSTPRGPPIKRHLSAVLLHRSQVVCATTTGLLRMFNAQTGRLVTRLAGHAPTGGGIVRIWAVGRSMWSQAADGSLKLWTSKRGHCVIPQPAASAHGDDGVDCDGCVELCRPLVSSMSDHTIVAAAASDEEDPALFRAWDAHTGNCLRSYHGAEPGASSPSVRALDTDETRIVGVTEGGLLRVWHWHDQRPAMQGKISCLPSTAEDGEGDRRRFVSISLFEDIVAVCAADSSVHLLSLN